MPGIGWNISSSRHDRGKYFRHCKPAIDQRVGGGVMILVRIWPARPAAAASEFWRDRSGQDLVEYSLLLGFVCLAGAATFIGMGQTTAGLWSIVNSRLAAANQSS
jgi:Flp pilus assembly pilin Flp